MAKALSRKVTIYIDGREVKSTISSLNAELKKLQAQQKNMVIGSEEYIKTSMKIKEITAVINEQKRAVNGLGNEWKSTTTRVAEFANMVTGLNSAFNMIDLGIGKVKDLAKAAAELDDVYADVMKTTGLSHEQVEKLNAAFAKMDTRTSREQLNQLAYEAGKLGINSEEAVAGFVSAADKINIALGDVLGEGAMVTIGKLSGVYEQSTKQLADSAGDIEAQMLKIGSAINMLGQSSTANEHYLVDFMGRLGGIATQAGLSADQILGYASALDQDMQKVEMSATAFQKLIQQMIKKPEEFVQAARMPMAEFQKLMETDMNAAIQKVLQGFNEMGGLNQLIPIFKDMGLDGARAASVIAAMASSLDKITEAQRIANDELETGSSVINEFNTKNNTLQAQAEKAKKRFEEIRIELGNELYPVLIHLQKTGTVLMKGFAGLIQLVKENKAILPGLIALMANWTRVKLLNFAANGKMLASAKSLLGIEKLQGHQADVQAAKEAKLIAAKEQERLASLKSQLAIEKENLARQQNSKLIELQKLAQITRNKVYALEVAVTEQSTVATNANTAAVKAQKAAFASTPWGLIITALTSIAALTVSIVRNSEKWKLNQTLKEAAKQSGEAEGQLKVLFGRLQDATAGSEAYKKAVDELKAAYPDLISKHIDEEGKIKDLTAAYNDLAAAARQSVYDRMYSEKVGELQGELAEQLRKTLMGVSNWVDRYMSKMTEAERDAVRSQMNVIVREFSEGKYSMDEALNRMNKIMVKARGLQEGAITTYTGLLSGLNDKMKETEKITRRYKAELKANDLDPFGVQKMSLKELEAELNKYLDLMDHGFSEGAERDAARLKAYRDQIKKLKEEAKKDTTTTTTTTDFTIPEDPDEKAEKKIADAQARIDKFLKDQNRKIEDLRIKLAGKVDETKLTEAEKAARKLAEQLRAIDRAIEDAVVDTEHATPEQIKKVNELREAYKKLRQEIVAAGEKAIEEGERLDLLGDAPERMKEAAEEAYQGILDAIDSIDTRSSLEKWCDNNLDTIQQFASQATSILSSVSGIFDNIGNQELKDAETLKDENIKLLDEQLEQQLITQEEYEARKDELNEDYAEKEKEIRLEQWNRNKLLSSGEAVIEGALAVLKALNDKTIPSTAARIAMAATISAATLAEIIKINTEPAPYAKGGYVEKRTVYQAGEAGREWVASNRLLNDPQTAPLIQALESYQRGNVRALGDIPMAQLNMPVVTAAARELGRRATTSPVTHAAAATRGDDMLSVMRELAKYLEDPRNRQAVISRQTMTDFDNNENFLRNHARLG